MKLWPWLRWFPCDESSPPDPRELEAARRARERAEALLREVREQGKEVARVAESLRKIRRRNHLVDILRESLRERERRKGEPGHG